MLKNLFKSYHCIKCGFEKNYISHPMLSDKRNIIADNCPNCFFGSMIINFDDVTNFDDDYLEKFHKAFYEHLEPNLIGEI